MADPTGVGNYLMGGIGVLNIATVVYLVRVVIAPLAQVVKGQQDSIKELLASRDDHRDKLTRIQVVHTMKGCDHSTMGNG